jgi:uncharacterized damage-inducible protein DinB
MESAMPLLKEAALKVAKDCHERMRKAVLKADIQALNWRPAPDTTSIYVLVNHALNAQKTWLTNAVGAEFKDRPARADEFAMSGEDRDALLKRIDQAEAEVTDYLSRLTSEDFSRQLRRFGDEPVSGAWAFLHCLEHPQEHIAQIELTLQIWEQQHSPVSCSF